MTTLIAAPLTAEAFRPFGTVSDLSELSGLLPVPAAYAATGTATEPVLQLVRIEAVPQPLTIAGLEFHPHSAQTFLALDQAPSLIVVCDRGADGGPDPATLRAFVAQPTQIVTYRRGTLHHRLTPLRAPALFAMTMMHAAAGDTVLVDLPEPVGVSIVP